MLIKTLFNPKTVNYIFCYKIENLTVNLHKISNFKGNPIIRSNHYMCYNDNYYYKFTDMTNSMPISRHIYSGISSIFFLNKLQRLQQLLIQKSRLSTFGHRYILNVDKFNTLSYNINHCRYKSKNTKKRPEYDSESDSDEEEIESAPGDKIIKIMMQSLRLDGVLKKSLNIARNKIETAFYEGNIRVNGKKPSKKSFQLQIGDEVDLIRGTSPMNPDFLTISRVEIVSVKESSDDDNEDKLVIRIRRTKTMYVENYNQHPWKKGSSAE